MKCCTTNTPKLNNLVTVHALKTSLTPNAGGHVDETDETKWRQVGREWAAVKTMGTREVVIDDQVRAFSTHEWTIRCPRNGESPYTTGMQLRMGGRRFNISEPPYILDEQNEWIVINTIEVPTT